MAIHKRKKKKIDGKRFTKQELVALARIFLDRFEADLTADFRPEEPLWRKLLAERLAEFQYTRGQQEFRSANRRPEQAGKAGRVRRADDTNLEE